jgi:hypothetical protein
MCGLAVLASTIASAVGAVIFVAWSVWHLPPSTSEVPPSSLLIVPLWLMTAMIAFIVGLPALLMVCAPLTWPLRQAIVRFPSLAGLALGLVGLVLGPAVIALFDKADSSPWGAPSDFVEASFFFGPSFALSWVWTVWRARRHFSE